MYVQKVNVYEYTTTAIEIDTTLMDNTVSRHYSNVHYTRLSISQKRKTDRLEINVRPRKLNTY